MKNLNNALAILLVFCAITAMNSCGNTGPATVNGKIRSSTVISSVTGYVFSNYTYDLQGRLTLIQNYNRAGVFTTKSTYTYNTNTVNVSNFDSGATTSTRTVDNLNGRGYLSSIVGFPSAFIYNSEGYLTFDSINENSEAYTIKNGNVMTEVNYGNTGTYTYLTDKIDYRDFGLAFLGKGSQNLPDTLSVTPNPHCVTYSYDYDSQKRVTKETRIISGNAPSTKVTTYTYFD